VEYRLVDDDGLPGLLTIPALSYVLDIVNGKILRWRACSWTESSVWSRASETIQIFRGATGEDRLTLSWPL
jgi:hypothetical protein